MAATTLVIWLGAFVYFSLETGHFFTAFLSEERRPAHEFYLNLKMDKNIYKMDYLRRVAEVQP